MIFLSYNLLMKIFASTLFIGFALALSANSLKPVAFVDAAKFSGLWYEVARTYNSYQEKCVASSVEYKLVEPLEYEVHNRCFDTKIGGELIEYEGSAKPVFGASMSSIEMTYFWIFTKRYSVYYLTEEYSYAVVADENFEQVWIMSRTPMMPKEQLDEILALLANAMDTQNFIFTPQDEKGRYR